MVHLTQLPVEILHNILGFVEPADLGNLPRTCRHLYGFVTGNAALCRDIYYRMLDEPASTGTNWEQELHDLVRLQLIGSRQGIDKRAELPFVSTTVLRLLRNATKSTTQRTVHSLTYPPSRNASLLTTFFRDDSNREAFLSRSFLFERARGCANCCFHTRPLEDHQLSAKLHSLFGMPLLKHGRTRSSSMYPFACSKVYDLREYTHASRWGPFMNDDSERVDWEKVEAILMVLRSNIKTKGLDSFPIFSNYWNTPFAGSWPGSYVPWPPGPGEGEESELKRRDPYGVSGTWLRVVCFLDYNDFFNFNFPVADELPTNVPRPTLDTGEAIRLILMKIHVTRIEEPAGGSAIVHFKGFSRSLDGSWDDNANSDLRGTAQLTPEGEVRWTTYSIFSGEERWKSEGIQLGGPRSARGVVGNWFDKDYDPQGPCGPTAFWKISDREPKTADKQFLLHDFLPIDGFEEDFDDHDFGTLGGELFLPDDLGHVEFGFSNDDDDDYHDDDDLVT